MEEDAVSAFRKWLELHGAQLSGLHVRPCVAARNAACEEDWGLGVFTDQAGCNAQQGVLCRIPLASCLALTVQRCVEDPQVGPFLAGLLAEGEVDSRQCLMLYLMVQRALGQRRSSWGPYLAVLPQHCNVPLTWRDQDLCALGGTPLLAATLSKRRQLQAMWHAQVQQLVRVACEHVGVAEVPCFADWVWAYTLVWSRLLEWPSGGSGDGDGDGESDAASMHEGLLPFIDCCNHAPSSSVLHRTDGDSLVLWAAAPLPPSSQVCISYGHKSNEELLFLYGFALPSNPRDRLLLHVPPATLHAATAIEARLELLRRRDLSLRWLLPDPAAEPDAAEATWQEVLAAAHVVTMPAAEAEAAAAAREGDTDVGAVVVGSAEEGEGGRVAAAVRWAASLLTERMREIDTGVNVEEVARRGWGWGWRGGEDGAAEEQAAARAVYCEYYRTSERRLCSAYLDKAT